VGNLLRQHSLFVDILFTFHKEWLGDDAWRCRGVPGHSSLRFFDTIGEMHAGGLDMDQGMIGILTKLL
jgi:hypothetical protein